MVTLLRKINFSATHLYRVAEWTEEENKQVFGLCSNINGHGHDYVLEIMVRGPLDETTGIVINITDIKQIVEELVNEELNGKFLNYEHPYFQQHIPTTENIVTYLWNQLDSKFKGCELYKIKLYENQFLFSQRGRDSMIHLTRKYHFSAAHRLHSHLLTDSENKEIFGKCNNPHGHGHNYFLEVTVSGEPDTVTGMVMNLSELDQTVNQVVIDKFDHKHLNLDTEEFRDLNPTSDNLVVVVWNMLSPHLPKLFKVGVWETDKNYFEYYGPGR
jgi:6-pyruvoyltetrahydropterin/6-carboxytetrahydropterin synthase